jgi:hypothetical protein
MSHYFVGRLNLGEPLEVRISGHKKVRCAIFQRWLEKQTYECSCGLSSPFKVTKTWGISQKESELLENTIGSSIGKKGIAELKSSIKSTLGREVEWTYTKAEEMSFVCEAPECGRREITVYQLVNEFELVEYSRGYLFKKNVWDRTRARMITEELASYSSTQDTLEYDERCKNCEAKASPEFDGRLSLDFGPLCLLVPYKINRQQLDMRLGKFGVKFPVLDYDGTFEAMQNTGLTITLRRDFIDPALIFLSGLSGKEFEGQARIYWDEGTLPATMAQAPIKLKEYTAIQEIESKQISTSGA